MPLNPEITAILVIDMQNYCCHPLGGEWASQGGPAQPPSPHYLDALPQVLGCIQSLLDAARARGVECIYTTIESLTLDGRDRSLDYKLSGFNVPRGSWDAQVLAEIAPQADEMVLPKCSSCMPICGLKHTPRELAEHSSWICHTHMRVHITCT